MGDWTQSICGACWRAYSIGKWGDVREPVTIKNPQREECAFCGGLAEQGIYVRANPRLVPYPRVAV